MRVEQRNDGELSGLVGGSPAGAAAGLTGRSALWGPPQAHLPAGFEDRPAKNAKMPHKVAVLASAGFKC